MLKSLSTQFVATLFFGPLGLAYSSVAAAVFLSLILAVLFFTELGTLSVLVVWPIAIVTGLILVKLHNDQIRSSGSTLLLGPDEEEGEAISTFGSWGRGIAVLSLLGIGGYGAYWYSSQAENSKMSDNVVNAAPADSSLTGSVESSDQLAGEFDGQFGGNNSGELAIAKTYPLDENAVVVPSSSSQSGSSFSVVTPDQRESVSIGTSSSEGRGGNLMYVDSEMVNLRDGPGTNFSILDQVERGDELSEIDRAGSWIRVTATESGATGWIFSRLVSSQR